ncbi:hypothetical protein BDZ89DRAFT_1077012 [Hymenopellis radicata]|nr:hypothetical protein BDZ89DRAFT_1077012 [Hymenopellis radicata]
MPSISLLPKRDNGLTYKDGSLNGNGAVVVARRRRQQREALGNRTYSAHHTKNNSDTGHLLAQSASWIPDAHKDGLPTFTTSAPPVFHFPPETFGPAFRPETFNTSGPSVTSTARDGGRGVRSPPILCIHIINSRPPSTVMMLEESAVPFMRESLPPLSIPAVDTANYTSAHPVAVMDTPLTSAVSSATSESIYSQASATASRHRHTLSAPSPPPIPSTPTLIPASPVPSIPGPARRALPQIPDDVLRRVEQAELPGADLERAPTKVIATLVKKRAHGAELNRNGTAVSRIERSDSITSFDGPQGGEDEAVEEFHPSTGRRRMKTTRRKWEAARARQRSVAEAELVDVPISTTETSFPLLLRVEKRHDDTVTLDS